MNDNYSMLVEDLLLGREFEFTYNNKTYGIINAHEGSVLCTDNKAISPYYEDVRELLSKVKIEDKSVEEIFNNVDDYYIL